MKRMGWCEQVVHFKLNGCSEQMASLNDTIALGLVLVLLFGAAALYLYTRIQQCEQKLNLVESILLDIKMSAELREYPEMKLSSRPSEHRAEHRSEQEMYSSALEEAHLDSLESEHVSLSVAPASAPASVTTGTPVVNASSPVPSSVLDIQASPLDNTLSVSEEPSSSKSSRKLPSSSGSMTANYEAMTLVELKDLAKSRGIKGSSVMRRGQVLEALRAEDSGEKPKPSEQPLKLDESMLTSLLEHASSFEGVETLA